MKFSTLLLVSLLVSFNTNDTVDSYDWSSYEVAAKEVNEAISKVVNAHMMIHDNLNLQVDQLPEKTKSQLVIIQDAAYKQWLTAEDHLGKNEAAEYWNKYNSTKDKGGRLQCSTALENNMQKQLSAGYDYVEKRGDKKLSDAHLNVIQARVSIYLEFYKCMGDKYGDIDSPLKKRSAISGQ